MYMTDYSYNNVESSVDFLSVYISWMLLPATGILMGELFKTLPVVSVDQTDNWLCRRANTHSVHSDDSSSYSLFPTTTSI